MGCMRLYLCVLLLLLLSPLPSPPVRMFLYVCLLPVCIYGCMRRIDMYRCVCAHFFVSLYVVSMHACMAAPAHACAYVQTYVYVHVCVSTASSASLQQDHAELLLLLGSRLFRHAEVRHGRRRSRSRNESASSHGALQAHLCALARHQRCVIRFLSVCLSVFLSFCLSLSRTLARTHECAGVHSPTAEKSSSNFVAEVCKAYGDQAELPPACAGAIAAVQASPGDLAARPEDAGTKGSPVFRV